jgi:hypothetical protein
MADRRCTGRFLSQNSTDFCSWDLLLPPLSCRWTPRRRLWEQSSSPDFRVVIVHVSVVPLRQETHAVGHAPPGRVPAAAVRLAALARLHPGRPDHVAPFFFRGSDFPALLLGSGDALLPQARRTWSPPRWPHPQLFLLSPFHPSRLPFSPGRHSAFPEIARCLPSYPHRSPATPLL